MDISSHVQSLMDSADQMGANSFAATAGHVIVSHDVPPNESALGAEGPEDVLEASTSGVPS